MKIVRRGADALARLHQDRSAAAAVEYALLLAFIAAVIVGAVTVLGTQIAAALVSFTASF